MPAESWISRIGKVLPGHQAPECPACAMECVIPVALHPEPHRLYNAFGPKHLCCAGCGHAWVETEISTIAQAWWGAGGYEEQKQLAASTAPMRGEV